MSTGWQLEGTVVKALPRLAEGAGLKFWFSGFYKQNLSCHSIMCYRVPWTQCSKLRQVNDPVWPNYYITFILPDWKRHHFHNQLYFSLWHVLSHCRDGIRPLGENPDHKAICETDSLLHWREIHAIASDFWCLMQPPIDAYGPSW